MVHLINIFIDINIDALNSNLGGGININSLSNSLHSSVIISTPELPKLINSK